LDISRDIISPRDKEIMMIEEFKNNKYVKIKELGDGIVSVNYSNKAFYSNAWDKYTIKARGLFVNENNDKVVARSYDKFFAIGEMQNTRWYLKNVKYPLDVYQKENGFLGILSVVDGKFFIASKSTNRGRFAKSFSDLFNTLVDDADGLKEYLSKNDVSAVFEVIDVVNDHHIVSYDESKLFLLDLIRNDYAFQTLGYKEVVRVARLHGFTPKKHIATIHDEDELMDFLIAANGAQGIEGYVVNDSNGMMFKVKTGWYRYWKSIRSILGRMKLQNITVEQADKNNIINNDRISYQMQHVIDCGIDSNFVVARQYLSTFQ
jgi:tRNA splicing ligase